jgi:hypothetical protein
MSLHVNTVFRVSYWELMSISQDIIPGCVLAAVMSPFEKDGSKRLFTTLEAVG